MALSVERINRIFAKAFPEPRQPLYRPVLRKAGHFERTTTEDGKQIQWVLDNGDHVAQRGGVTLNALIAQVLEDFWPEFDAAQLTEAERRELRAIPSRVARLI